MFSDSFRRATVTDLADARGQRARRPRTLMLQVSHVRADAEAHRHIGLNDSLHLRDLHSAIRTCFSLQDDGAPWSFSADGQRLPADLELHDALSVGEDLSYGWGLWQFTVTAFDSWPRDGGTPRALCVGGSGEFGGVELDLAAINSELTGTETTATILGRTIPEVRSIIERSGIFDFVPLLQALDLSRSSELSAEVVSVLRQLPEETDPAAVDAFWVSVLTLSSLADEDAAHHILADTMAALGWVEDDGTELTWVAARQLCAASLAELATLGAYGENALGPVDRLDIYRELLRSDGRGD